MPCLSIERTRWASRPSRTARWAWRRAISACVKRIRRSVSASFPSVSAMAARCRAILASRSSRYALTCRAFCWASARLASMSWRRRPVSDWFCFACCSCWHVVSHEAQSAATAAGRAAAATAATSRHAATGSRRTVRS